MIRSEEPGFIQYRKLLPTLVSFCYCWDFGRMLLWDQSQSGRGLLGVGRRASITSPLPCSWVSRTGLFITWQVQEKWENLPEISSRAALEWIYSAGYRRRDEKEKHCALLVPTKPSTFNKPAIIRGFGASGFSSVTCHARQIFGLGSWASKGGGGREGQKEDEEEQGSFRKRFKGIYIKWWFSHSIEHDSLWPHGL